MATSRPEDAASVLAEPLRPTAPPQVHSFEPNVRERWDQFVLGQPTGAPFHLIAWKRVLEKTFGYQACYLYAVRGGEITAVAPLFLISNWVLGRCLISAPLGVYAGICAADVESEQALLEHIKQLAVREQVEYLELRNRSGELYPEFHANQLYVTFSCPLLPNVEKNLKRLPKDTRYMIRKAEKAGLEARYGTEPLDAFYHLFAQNMRKLGTPVFPRKLFANIIEEFGAHANLLMIYSAGKPVAGVLSLLFNDAVFPYYSGASPEAPRLAANNFLYWKLMETMAREGFRTFDFGRSKKGTGAFAFKSQWNMTVEPLNYQVYLVKRKTVPNFSPVNPKFQLAARVWQKLPLWLSKQVGPSVVRWFP